MKPVQTEIAVDTTLPPLPPPPEFWPMTTSVYGRHSSKSRDHCTVCVHLCHSGDWGGPPRPAYKVRRKVKGASMKDPGTLLLCVGHAQQYIARDSEARERAGLPPLSGGA